MAGVEQDYLSDPVPDDLIDLILKKNSADKKDGKGTHSLPVTFAIMLREKGGQELREIMGKLNDSAISNPLDSIQFAQLKPEDQKAIVVNYAAVLFGSVVPSIETMIFEKRFDISVFESQHNTAISGTNFPQVKIDAVSPSIMIPDSTWNLAHQKIKRDPSFGSFFEEQSIETPNGAYVCLPSVVRSQLGKNNLITAVRDLILPAHRKVYSKLAPHTFSR